MEVASFGQCKCIPESKYLSSQSICILLNTTTTEVFLTYSNDLTLSSKSPQVGQTCVAFKLVSWVNNKTVSPNAIHKINALYISQNKCSLNVFCSEFLCMPLSLQYYCMHKAIHVELDSVL